MNCTAELVCDDFFLRGSLVLSHHSPPEFDRAQRKDENRTYADIFCDNIVLDITT